MHAFIQLFIQCLLSAYVVLSAKNPDITILQ